MLPRTFALTDTLERLNTVMSDAEGLLSIGQKEAAVDLIRDTSPDFVMILSQFDDGYFSNRELESIRAYDVILKICDEFKKAKKQSYDINDPYLYEKYLDDYYDDLDEGDTIYEW